MSIYKSIQATSHDGDFVLETQKVARREGFRNVSKTWYDKTRPIDKEIERLAATRSKRESLSITFRQIEPTVHKHRFALRVRDRILRPDSHAARQLGAITGIGTYYAYRLFQSERAGADEALVYALDYAWPDVRPDYEVVLRVEDGDRLRAVLPARSTFLRGEWYLRVIARAIPGGRLSHWRGDAYTIYGNVLIPDTIRNESDSDYGAMLALSNCEIGKRKTEQRPSLFRAICMNGCIWGQTEGKALVLSRRASYELADLEKHIVTNIHDQIPVATSALDRFLATRSLESNVSMKAVIAQTSKDFRLTKRLASSVLHGWWVEKRETPELANTLFAVINGVTRAAQRENNEVWGRLEEAGGKLATWDRKRWDHLLMRSSRLSREDVNATFADWQPESAA